MRFGSNTIKHSFFKIRDGLFGGRIARTTYIIRVAILGGVLAILAIPIGTILSTSPQTLQDAYMVLALGMLALCLIGFICTYVRRLHDIGLSGFWALPALLGLPPLIFFLSTEYASYRNGQDPYDDLSAFLNLSLFAALLLPLMIALWRGQANANRFGPVPEAVESLSSSKVSMAALLGAAAILIPTSIYIGLFQEGVWVGRGRYPPSMPMIDSNTKGHRLAKCWNLKGEGKPYSFRMALSGRQSADLSRCQCMTLPIGTVARPAPAGALRQKGCHTRGKVINRKRRATSDNRRICRRKGL